MARLCYFVAECYGLCSHFCWRRYDCYNCYIPALLIYVYFWRAMANILIAYRAVLGENLLHSRIYLPTEPLLPSNCLTLTKQSKDGLRGRFVFLSLAADTSETHRYRSPITGGG